MKTRGCYLPANLLTKWARAGVDSRDTVEKGALYNPQRLSMTIVMDRARERIVASITMGAIGDTCH